MNVKDRIRRRATDRMLVELLAIKLYEHDHQDGLWPPVEGSRMTNWFKMSAEDRQIYRDIAAGKEELP